MSLMRDAIGVLLAGGQGERLWPLTRDRAKPAVPFGAVYRIIDITLSNCINSDLRRVFVLTQYKLGFPTYFLGPSGYVCIVAGCFRCRPAPERARIRLLYRDCLSQGISGRRVSGAAWFLESGATAGLRG